MTAEDQLEAHDAHERLDAVYDAIESRRDCGNRLVITQPGHAGLAPDTLEDLKRWATDDPLDLCPALTADELDELRMEVVIEDDALMDRRKFGR